MIPPSSLDAQRLARVFRPKLSPRGLLITIDGFDGSGKSTQIDGLASRLREAGRTVVLTRQPTDWYREADAVRHFHDHGGSERRARMLALFAAADRHRHVMEVIEPALEEDCVVISDRYVLATFAVFTHRGIDPDFLVEINSTVPRPDFSFYLDVPTDVLLKRLRDRDGDNLKHEEKSADRVNSIKARWTAMQPLLTVVDGTASPAAISEQLYSICTAAGGPEASLEDDVRVAREG